MCCRLTAVRPYGYPRYVPVCAAGYIRPAAEAEPASAQQPKGCGLPSQCPGRHVSSRLASLPQPAEGPESAPTGTGRVSAHGDRRPSGRLGSAQQRTAVKPPCGTRRQPGRALCSPANSVRVSGWGLGRPANRKPPERGSAEDHDPGRLGLPPSCTGGGDPGPNTRRCQVAGLALRVARAIHP
jgi:hypothetical protein